MPCYRLVPRKRHKRHTKRGLVIVRRHPLTIWSWKRDSHYTEIAGWRKGIGRRLGRRVRGVRPSKKFNAGSVYRRLEAGENVRLTSNQKRGVEAFMQKQIDSKRYKKRERQEYAKMVKEGKAW